MLFVFFFFPESLSRPGCRWPHRVLANVLRVSPAQLPCPPHVQGENSIAAPLCVLQLKFISFLFASRHFLCLLQEKQDARLSFSFSVSLGDLNFKLARIGSFCKHCSAPFL